MELVNIIIICLLFIVIHIILWKLLKFVISKYRHRHRHSNDIEDNDDVYDSDNNDDEIREGFTPKIRETYRSYVRIIESSYNNKKNDLYYIINKFFRKLGLR